MALNFGQYQVAAQHALSYGAGLATMAATWGLVSQFDAASFTENLTDIYNGSVMLAQGLVGLVTTAGSVYAAYKAVHAASPSEQVKTVVASLQAPASVQAANVVADPSSRKNLISAVANMPEVKGIVATPSVAADTASSKVVAAPKDVKL